MKKQEDIFENKILTSVGENYSSTKLLTGFMARRGAFYNGELMVVGRAVNGWISKEDACFAHDFIDSQKRFLFREAAQSVDANHACPMQWVTQSWNDPDGYSTSRSAFWRVIKSLIQRLNIEGLTEENWPSYLVWSNLYKISPYEGRNPSDKLCSIQVAACNELFQQELSEYKPKRLLLLTGENWAKDFLPDVCSREDNSGFYVHASGVLNDASNTKVVVACHPERKKETLWGQEVYSAFETI